MSKVLNMKLNGCSNGYTVEDLMAGVAFSDTDTTAMKKCMNCKNRVMDDGIITCKYLLAMMEGGVDSYEDGVH